ncbi:MAG: DUF2264 domain-containing protein [Victivallales bacterium]|nr:DUF2264 domain-containing protein [Victivallales bacterium]
MRKQWIARIEVLSKPVLSALAQGKLRKILPVGGDKERANCTHLEAMARTLTGIAPFLALQDNDPARMALTEIAQKAIMSAMSPDSPDYLGFHADKHLSSQTLVDAAFFAHALLRAPERLFGELQPQVQMQILSFLRDTRCFIPPWNNWLLFTGMVEAALWKFSGECDLVRVDFIMRQMEDWAVGDGFYSDGECFALDYYNSFVIHPMFLDIVELFKGVLPVADKLCSKVHNRMIRLCEIQERIIAPDGSFPAIGRSITYRCGAFQLLAQMALRDELPKTLSRGAVREALNAVIKRTLDTPETFSETGFLNIGLCGNQPNLGEHYISTGSLYLATTAFLPLGLPDTAGFWTDPATSWSAQRIWSGQNVMRDHASGEK